jgi:hypothetical protein
MNSPPNFFDLKTKSYDFQPAAPPVAKFAAELFPIILMALPQSTEQPFLLQDTPFP